MRTALFVVLLSSFASAQFPASTKTIDWMGHTWRVSEGRIAGVVPARRENLSIDSTGALHMRVSRVADGFTDAEIFTTDEMGFGTYQWQLTGSNIYDMDPTMVIGLFAYGPVHHKGKNAEEEIDIEFSQWNHTTPKPVNADFTVYPPSGFMRPNGDSAWEDNFLVAEHPNQTTARFVWSADKIDFYIMAGHLPITAAPDHILKHDTLTSDGTNVPHVTLPIGMNLWSFKEPPQHELEIVVNSFEYLPAPKSDHPVAKVVPLESAVKELAIVSGPPESAGMRSGLVNLPAGASVGEHSTGDHEEVLVVLEGRGEMMLGDGTKLALEANHAVYCPPKTTHNVRNTGSGTMKYVFVVAAKE